MKFILQVARKIIYSEERSTLHLGLNFYLQFARDEVLFAFGSYPKLDFSLGFKLRMRLHFVPACRIILILPWIFIFSTVSDRIVNIIWLSTEVMSLFSWRVKFDISPYLISWFCLRLKVAVHFCSGLRIDLNFANPWSLVSYWSELHTELRFWIRRCVTDHCSTLTPYQSRSPPVNPIKMYPFELDNHNVPSISIKRIVVAVLFTAPLCVSASVFCLSRGRVHLRRAPRAPDSPTARRVRGFSAFCRHRDSNSRYQ